MGRTCCTTAWAQHKFLLDEVGVESPVAFLGSPRESHRSNRSTAFAQSSGARRIAPTHRNGSLSVPRISTAKGGAVATGETLQEVMPFVDERGQPVVHRSRAWRRPIRTKGAVTPPHSAPVLPMPPGNPAVSLTSHSASVSEASSSVCITVGAQWPILSRFDILRRRSVFVGTVVRSPARFRGMVGEDAEDAWSTPGWPLPVRRSTPVQNWRPRAYAFSK